MPAPAALARATYPAPLLDLLQRLADAGHRSWLVGGAVRDLVLGRHRNVNDFDVATPATPDQVTALFPKVIPTGIAHGTVTVVVRGEPIEVTTFRGEGAYRDGRRPESVTFHTDLEADLSRRDFTMNALAYDPLAGDFRDYFGGREDLRHKRVRAVGEAAVRFAEDGLRPMRAVRFSAQLGFTLDPATLAAIPGALEVVRKVAAERITDELSRLLEATWPARALEMMRETGLVGVVLPELARCSPARLAHAEAVVQRAPPDLPARLAALLHVLGPERAALDLDRLRLSRKVADEAAALLRAHACSAPGDEPHAPPPAGAAAVRRWLSRIGPERVGMVLELAEADARSLPSGDSTRAAAEVRKLKAEVDAVLAAAPPLAVAALALDGRAVAAVLGGPGPHVGEALRHLLDRVLDDPGRNQPAVLAEELRTWWAARNARL